MVANLAIQHLPTTVRNYQLKGIPVGTFSDDNDDPKLCRVVYLTLGQYGTTHYHLSNIGIDGQLYNRRTKSKRKTAKGSVKLSESFKRNRLLKAPASPLTLRALPSANFARPSRA